MSAFLRENMIKQTVRGFGLCLVALLMIFPVESRPGFSGLQSGLAKSADKMMIQTKQTEVPTGEWGGRGIRLVLEKSGGQLEFDCAEGEISQKLTMNKKGSFTANGFFIRRYPGPIRTDIPLKKQPARFSGKVSGKNMTLKITLTESKEDLGSFILQRGDGGNIRGCR